MDVFFRTSSFSSSPWTRQGSTSHLFSFSYLSVLLSCVFIVAFICILHDSGCVVETYWLLSVDVPQMRLDGHLDLPSHASHVPFNCY
jgi:hypothetical protein